MINANELRIGNWVEANSPMMIVKEISKDDIGLYMPNSEADNFHYYPHEVHPIPLTPEILEKCGFERMIPSWYNDVDSFSNGKYFISEDWFHIHEKDQGLARILNYSIKYLHQIQNLYFALTGAELNVEL